MRMVGLAVIAALLLTMAAPAGASLLNDWFGVELAVGRSGNFDHDWAPVTSTADYFIDDNWSAHLGRPAYGGEQFDIEAMYFDDDAENAYVAVVTSLPLPGGTFFVGEHVAPGDLGIDLGNGAWDIGVDIDGGTGEVADTDLGNWYQSNQNFVAERGPTNFSGGSTLGAAEVQCYDTGLMEGGFGTYVFEVTIAKSLLRDPATGDYIGLDWTMGCRNDFVHLDGTFSRGTVDDPPPPPPPVPEPGTFMLLGTGLLGMVGFARRRRG